MIGNEKYINACDGVAQGGVPIWMMRQAGRYHGHYQNLKKDHSFLDLCKQPELAAEVAMGPMDDFDFDVAIMFSDLLFPLEALGLSLIYDPGPKLSPHLRPDNFKDLRPWKEGLPNLEFQNRALDLTRGRLGKNKSLVGFVGGPWTLFSYAVEGAHNGNLIETKKYLDLFDLFCEQLVPLLLENIRGQLASGAERVMIFDTAVGELDVHLFDSLVLPHLDPLARAFPGKLVYYSKGTTRDHLKSIWANSNWGGFGVDHRWDMVKVLKETRGLKMIKQGNFDQSLLFSKDFKLHLKSYLQRLQAVPNEERAGWVCGLGHGILPKTPEESVRQFVKITREMFA